MDEEEEGGEAEVFPHSDLLWEAPIDYDAAASSARSRPWRLTERERKGAREQGREKGEGREQGQGVGVLLSTRGRGDRPWSAGVARAARHGGMATVPLSPRCR